MKTFLKTNKKNITLTILLFFIFSFLVMPTAFAETLIENFEPTSVIDADITNETILSENELSNFKEPSITEGGETEYDETEDDDFLQNANVNSTFSLKRVGLTFSSTDKKIQYILSVNPASTDPDLLLDYVEFTVYVNDLDVLKYRKTNVPIGVYKGDINLNQVLCHEQIKATITAKEDGNVQTWTVFDSRDLSASTIAMWAPGSNGTPERNIERHFVKHSNDTYVKASTISEYCNQASSQLKTVRGQHVVGTLTTGYTPSVYKFYYNNKYIMVVGTSTNPSGGIISFGGGRGGTTQD